MKTLEIITALSLLGNLTCECCHRRLISNDEDGTVIKKHLVKTFKRQEVIEVECRYCGYRNVIAHNN